MCKILLSCIFLLNGHFFGHFFFKYPETLDFTTYSWSLFGVQVPSSALKGKPSIYVGRLKIRINTRFYNITNDTII